MWGGHRPPHTASPQSLHQRAAFLCLRGAMTDQITYMDDAAATSVGLDYKRRAVDALYRRSGSNVLDVRCRSATRLPGLVYPDRPGRLDDPSLPPSRYSGPTAFPPFPSPSLLKAILLPSCRSSSRSLSSFHIMYRLPQFGPVSAHLPSPILRGGLRPDSLYL